MHRITIEHLRLLQCMCTSFSHEHAKKRRRRTVVGRSIHLSLSQEFSVPCHLFQLFHSCYRPTLSVPIARSPFLLLSFAPPIPLLSATPPCIFLFDPLFLLLLSLPPPPSLPPSSSSSPPLVLLSIFSSPFSIPSLLILLFFLL